MILAATTFLIVFTGIDYVCRGWTKRKWLACILLILAGFVMATTVDVYTITSFILTGIVSGMLMLIGYIFVLRHHFSIIPIAVAVLFGLSLMKELFYAAYPASFMASILAIIIVFGAAFYWYRKLEEGNEL